jgi:hypothetical protein
MWKQAVNSVTICAAACQPAVVSTAAARARAGIGEACDEEARLERLPALPAQPWQDACKDGGGAGPAAAAGRARAAAAAGACAGSAAGSAAEARFAQGEPCTAESARAGGAWDAEGSAAGAARPDGAGGAAQAPDCREPWQYLPITDEGSKRRQYLLDPGGRVLLRVGAAASPLVGRTGAGTAGCAASGHSEVPLTAAS